MSASNSPLPPARRSFLAWSSLALLVVVSSYAVTLLLAAVCVYLPYFLVASGGFEAETLILACCSLIVAVAMLWSLVPPRDKTGPPGLRVEARDHPRLFAEIQGVAKALDESMPQEVYLTVSVGAFVTQWGGSFGYKSRRVRGLGLPLMQILTLSQFRAVLAHEFGHYYSGDTRLGPWVYRSRAAMIRNLRSVANRSPLLPSVMRAPIGRLIYYVVIRLLLGYWKVFLRATQLVSRRQEYRADEIACYTSGSQAFIEGLRATSAAEAALPAFWDQELVPALRQGCLPPVCEGFSRFLAAPKIAEAIENNLAQELRRPRTNPFDSHPPLQDRIAVAQCLPYGSPPQNECPATTLICDLETTEARLLEFVIRPKLDLTGFKRIGWNRIGSAAVLPAWKAFIQDFSKLLSGVAAESLPDAVGDLRSLGSHIPDPKGMLMTREQRDQRAAGLLAMALGVLLAEKGWEVHAQPGEFYLGCGSERLNPFSLIQDLARGRLTREAWIEKCRSWGIAGSQLFNSATAISTTSPNTQPA